MSDIAKKTLPPGCKANPEAKNDLTSTQDDGSTTHAVPRSVTNGIGAKYRPEDIAEETESYYTHEGEAAQHGRDRHEQAMAALVDLADDGLEATAIATARGDGDDEVHRKMGSTVHGGGHGHVDYDGVLSEAEAPDMSEPDGDEGYGSRSSLTEQAKTAFDLDQAAEASHGHGYGPAASLPSLSDGALDVEPSQVGYGGAEVGGDEVGDVGVGGDDEVGDVGVGGDEVDDDKVEDLELDVETAVPSAVPSATPSVQGDINSDSEAKPAVPDHHETQEVGEEQQQQQQQEKVQDVAEGVPTDMTADQLDTILASLPEELRSQLPEELRSRLSQVDGQSVHESAVPEPEPEPEHELEPEHGINYSILKNGRVNKGGNVVDEAGHVIGRVTEGVLMYLIGRKVDEAGCIWGDDGKVLGRAEPVSDSERDDMMKDPSPFESFPDAVVNADGMVVSQGDFVGKVVAGDVKLLRGKHVDGDGDILDRGGNVIGKAERWEPEEEPEPEPELVVDRSSLAGKRVNKAGNVVDAHGVIYGRVVEGDVKRLVGRMCDKLGNVLSESGDILGRADVVPEGEREGQKEGPFADLLGCTVARDGTVVTPTGHIVGRLVQGDGLILFGRAVDEDGDVVDRNGNVLGRAERWEKPEVEKKKNPLAGRRVNKQGDVVDEDGNLVGKLTTGSLSLCVGKEIDDDGDVVDGKGTVVGHVSLIDDIEPEPEESAEDIAKRQQAVQDKKLAEQMTVCINQCLEQIRPICNMITEKIDQAERQPEEDRDEEALVREVRPLIEEGGRILQEAKGVIKGLDPDGRISANAKHKTAAREASSEEYQLADALKTLTGEVTQCIENAKRKVQDMPHVKKELNPLWGLLNEPLFQILAAVGLLLNGVLSLVGNLLSGLGLGGLLDGILGTLGLNRVLEGLGLGQVTKSLTGGDKKKKGGGLLGGLLGGGK